MKTKHKYFMADPKDGEYKQPVDVPVWLYDVIYGVSEGTRHDTAVRLIGRWYGKGLRTVEVLMLLMTWNNVNSPPLSREEFTSILHSTLNWVRPRKEYEISKEEGEEYIKEIRKLMKEGKL